MANTLTNLLPTIVRGYDVVSRELVGFLPSITRDATTDRVAKNQTLYSWRTASASLSDITPANVSPQAADSSIGNVPITVTNFKMSDFFITGEEALGLGGNINPLMQDLVEQRIRAIVNQMESDSFTAASVGASRAYGTAGTTPFATTVAGSAFVRKILDDDGAPKSDRSLIVDTTCAANLRSLQQLTKANEAGSTMTLRDGELLNLNGLSIKDSAAVSSLAVGTATGATTDNAGYAVGATTITLASAGTGTILAGDIITFVGDVTDPTHQYIVATGNGNVSAGGTVVLQAPGLKKAIPTSTKAITVIAVATRNVAFSRNALLLAARLPALPPGGDNAEEREIVVDPRSSMAIEVSLYRQYRQLRVELAAAWSITVLKPEHIGLLLG